MFHLSSEFLEKARETAVHMEKTALESAVLTCGVFSGFLVKDGTEELQRRIDSGKPLILGPYVAESQIKYWITLE